MKVAVVVGSFNSSEKEWIRNILNTLNKCIDDLTILDYNQSNKVKGCLEDSVKVKKLNVISLQSWQEIEESYKNVLKDFDAVFIVRFPILDSLSKKSGVSLQNFLSNYHINDTFSMSFILMKNTFVKMMLLKVVEDLGIDLYHVIIDPQEIDYSKYFNFHKYRRLFQLKRKDELYAPYYEYCLQRYNQKNIKDKSLLLFFIGIIVSEDRYFLYDLYEYFKQFEDIHFGIYDKVKYKKKLPQDKYYEELEKSKYTLIIRAYDKKSFSMTRFMEAIVLDCIPLILDDVCLDELKNTFYDIYQIAKKLVVNKNEVYNRITSSYEQDYMLLQEIKKSKSYIKITDLEKIKKYYKKLLEAPYD